jgi:hypothetical protein
MSLLGALASGCDREAGIQTYVVPKEELPPVAQLAESTAAPTQPAIMQWELPEGWRIAPNPNAMRFATLIAGQGENQCEISITQLGGSAGGVEANINRWRQQLGLPAMTPEEMVRTVEIIDARGAQGMLVDLVSEPQPETEAPRQRMLAAIFTTPTHVWFIKAIATNEVLESHREAFAALCTSVSFDGGAAAASPGSTARPSAAVPASRGAPHWAEVPENWARDAEPQAMAVVSFTVAEGDQQAAMTVTQLGGGQDLLANINRWRRQVGLGPLEDLSEQPPVEIEIAGEPGHLLEAIGAAQGTIGAVSVRGAATWYYKLSGPSSLVTEQRAAFERFVRSTRFDGESGG